MNKSNTLCYKLNYYSFSLLFIFSSYFLTKITSISPIYFAFILSVAIFSFRYLVCKNKGSIDKYLSLSLLFPLLYLIINLLTYPESFKTAFVISLGYIYLIFSYILIRNLNIFDIIKVSKRYIIMTIPLLAFDLYYKITHPIMDSYEWYERAGHADQIIYAFKDSAIYLDANLTASLILINFFFLLYISKYLNKSMYILKIIYLFFIFTTLSKAAWISAIIFYILFKIFYDKEKKIIKWILIFILTSPFLFIIIQSNAEDGSLLTKFALIHGVFYNISNTLPLNEFLFGVGINNGQNYLGRAPHNIILFYLFENGFIILCIYFIVNVYLLIKTKLKAFWLFGPYFLAGMSAGATAIPYYFVMISIIITIERKKLEN